MASSLLLIDFDGTLFNTRRFFADIDERVWKKPTDQWTELLPDNKTMDVILNPDKSSNEDKHKLENAIDFLPTGDYGFADATVLVQCARIVKGWTVAVVTRAASKELQYFKREFCWGAEDLPFMITPENKGILISETVEKLNDRFLVDLPEVKGEFDRIVLIDDSSETFDPLLEAKAEIEMIHVIRKQPGGDQPTPDPVKRMTFLHRDEILG